MTRINLLPWREEARQRRRKEFAAAGGLALVFTLLLAVLVHLQIEGRIGDQQARNQLLDGEIAQLNRQIKEIQDLEKIKADLLSRMEIIQELQESRPEIVRLFEELVVTIPEGVYLTKLEQTGRTVVVEGRAQSNARVSAFMRNIEASTWIGSPRLLLIEDKTGTGLSQFRLAFDQVSPSADAAPMQTHVPQGTRSETLLMADTRR
ncbi:PilN domain-containing protein [Thiocapsa bogorovii]|uniref:PilN domain-containing protein n=1 Tax=Thiocapsa bogorovii TaxID=521689 RepID=UPI001E4F4603|nr:PilN domain-containing protein [Thiocapsa bogorovii]UHD14226.1 PilN domain-containing protein [Thiocapsa bogorovii]